MINDDNTKIKEWHETQKDLFYEIRKLQPELREALKKVMSLSDRITKDYVLMFAKSYIRLYDLLQDGFMSHRDSAVHSTSADYKHAVKNFEVCCSSSISSLAAFGVKGIIMEKGKPFDGEIYGAVSTQSFDSTRTYVLRA